MEHFPSLSEKHDLRRLRLSNKNLQKIARNIGYYNTTFITGRFKELGVDLDFRKRHSCNFSRKCNLRWCSSSNCCWFLLNNLNDRRLEANSWRWDFVHIRAMFHYLKWTTVRLQALWLVVDSVGVASVPASVCAASSSLRWKIRCTSRSKESIRDELLLNQYRRAARSLLTSTLSKSALMLWTPNPLQQL